MTRSAIAKTMSPDPELENLHCENAPQWRRGRRLDGEQLLELIVERHDRERHANHLQGSEEIADAGASDLEPARTTDGGQRARLDADPNRAAIVDRFLRDRLHLFQAPAERGFGGAALPHEDYPNEIAALFAEMVPTTDAVAVG
jgi:hypothetical protein